MRELWNSTTPSPSNANSPREQRPGSFRPRFRTIRSKTLPGPAGFLRKLRLRFRISYPEWQGHLEPLSTKPSVQTVHDLLGDCLYPILPATAPLGRSLRSEILTESPIRLRSRALISTKIGSSRRQSGSFNSLLAPRPRPSVHIPYRFVS